MSRWLTVTAVAVGTMGLATAASGATGWTVVAPPAMAANTNNTINGAFARTDADAWAVGTTYAASGAAPAAPVALHWNGTGWTSVPTPAPDPTTEASRTLVAVNASSATDAWAVGGDKILFSGYHGLNSLYEHWNGTAWSTVAGPNIGELVGVADFGASNAWAVSVNGQAAWWNGTAWSTVTVPAPDPSDTFSTQVKWVSSDGTNDIWAVGTYDAGLFSLHYNGTSWNVVPMAQPSAEAPGPTLSSVSAVSPTDVWAAGWTPTDPVVEHFDGTSWQLVPEPSGLFYPVINAVTARSASDVWIFGHAYTDASGSSSNQVLEHWNGSSWTRSPSPFAPNTYGVQFSSAASSPNHVWAFGYNTSNQPLILSNP